MATGAERWRRRQAEKMLSAEHQEALYRVQLALQRFHDLASNVPSAMLPPDSNLPIAQVQRDYFLAVHKSTKAFQRLVDFITRGVIPDDLEV